MANRLTAKQYVESGKHLPHPLRDFHDCKDLFKWIEGVCVSHVRDDKTSPTHYMNQDLPAWTTAQIYVIDYFLWFMGQFGYTLQRSRANVDFRSLEDEIESYKEHQRKQFRDMLEAERKKNESC